MTTRLSDAAQPGASRASKPGLTHTDESDLAYLKRLASAGRGEPAPFLLLMAVFGGGYGFVLLALFVLGSIDPSSMLNPTRSPVVIALNWALLACHALFALTLLWTAWRTLGPRRIKLSRSASATWSAAFVALVVIFVAFRLYTADEPSSDQTYTTYMMPPVLLVLWGCAWWVTALLNERRWLLLIALGSFAAAIAMAAVGNTPGFLPLSAACLILLAFVPAVALMVERKR